MNNILKWIDTEIVELNGDATISDVNAELGEYCLPAEPLSAKKTISRFVKEGGIGYNSLRNGTLGSSIFQLSSTFSGTKFTYGSKYKTLYNAGYPLHRIIEAPSFFKEMTQKFDQIENIVLPVRKNKAVELTFNNGQLDQFNQNHTPDHASNIIFINDFGAKLMGLEGEGVVTTYLRYNQTNGEIKKGIWEKRFLEDMIPDDHNTIKFLTMNSRVTEIYKVFNENSKGLFFALRVHKGILVLMSGEKRQLDTIGESIRSIPLTFEIGAL
ncbi:MAG: hypothetical protein KKA35_13090 [Proteobacteria bacterium]|nr:hypothetical protein [Pseudomonadota bacterium]